MKIALTLVALLGASAVSAATIVTVEAPDVQTTTLAATTGVETFDGLVNHYTSPYASTFGGGSFAGTFDALLADNANVYGGAGGTGRYVTSQTEVRLTLTGAATDYFGIWASSLDGGNTVAFYKGGVLVDSINLTAAAGVLPAGYSGNPNANYSGQNAGEKYAFFNFVVTGGFDQVRLIENSGGGFELDNVTVGSIATVPEPASWALMVAGFGLVGFGMRRRAAVSVTA